MSMTNRNNKMDENLLSLAKLQSAICEEFQPNFDKNILPKGRYIDYKIANTDFLKCHKPELIGCTALHLAFQGNNLKALNAVLKAGADVTAKNDKNMTVIHSEVEQKFDELETFKLVDRFRNDNTIFTLDDVYSFYIMKQVLEEKRFKELNNWRLRGKLKNPLIDRVFLAQLESENPANPCSDNGISHLHVACMTNNVAAVDFFVTNGVDVNQAVNMDSPIFPGFTPFHFAVWYSDVKSAEVLLNYKVNLYLTNGAGLTPLEMILDLNMKILEWMHVKGKLPYENAIVDFFNSEKILNAMMQTLEDSIDLIVLCAACTMKNIVWAKKLLEKMTDVNESLKADSMWPGWTALHFAAFFNNTEIIKRLLLKDADIEAKNTNGITPFDMLAQKAKIQDIVFILSAKSSWKNIILSDGKTLLTDVIYAMGEIDEENNEVDIFDNFLKNVDIDSFVPTDSPIWPGCTILHLAVIISEKLTLLNDFFDFADSDYKEKYEERGDLQEWYYLQNIEVCLKRNANVNIQDVRGRTPIHQAFRQRETKALDILLRRGKRIINTIDDDNLSTLHIACATKHRKVIKKLLADRNLLNLTVLPSFQWENQFFDDAVDEIFKLAGSTPLHIAVANEDTWITWKLLKRRPNLNAKDSYGLTPIHRIFVLRRIWQLGNKLHDKREPNDYTNDEELYYHPMNIPNYKQVSQYLSDNCNTLLSSYYLTESFVENVGLSHLHIACFENNFSAAESLLCQGSNPNVTLDITQTLDLKHPLFFLRQLSGYTALQISIYSCKPEVESLFIQWGADIFHKSIDGRSVIFEKLSQKSKYVHTIDMAIDLTFLREDEVARKRLFDEYGWTMLHVACKLLDFDMAVEALNSGIDVNSRIRDDANIYPGWTPLHILMETDVYAKFDAKFSSDSFEQFVQLLLDANADVSLADSNGKTPLHFANFQHERRTLGIGYEQSDLADLLLRYVKDFKSNPVDNQGISIFHIACIRHNVEVMENFFKNGIDVNQTVDMFADELAGCSSLHVVVRHIPGGRDNIRWNEHLHNNLMAKQSQAVGLLLKYGANVHKKDIKDNNLFHAAVVCCEPVIDLMQKFFKLGVDISLTNIFGSTAYQLWFEYGSVYNEKIEFFFNNVPRAVAVNSVTGQISIPKLFFQDLDGKSEESFLKLTGHPSLTGTDHMGRTAIHHLVSVDDEMWYNSLPAIMYLLSKGVDIDHPDNFGKTALHVAAQFRNFNGIEYLLRNGADFNIIDSLGKTAFSYATGPETLCNRPMSGIYNCRIPIYVWSFIKFFHEMDNRGLYVNEINRREVNQVKENFPNIDSDLFEDFIERRDTKIGSTSLTFGDFLSETGAIVNYPRMSKKDRDEIDEFFNIPEILCTDDWGNVFVRQYNKALERSKLVELAKDSMCVVLEFSLPDLCYDTVQKFLSNDDLKHLIKAAKCKYF